MLKEEDYMCQKTVNIPTKQKLWKKEIFWSTRDFNVKAFWTKKVVGH
jgi:hypothetical protein